MTLVWVTRARPGAEETAARLSAAGLIPLISPVLQVRALPAAIDFEGVGALAFTSANAVRAIAGLLGAGPPAGLRVFAVGAATAEAARRLLGGAITVEASAGDVTDLAEHLVRTAPSLSGAVLHLAAREQARDLSAMLAARGVAARRLIVYETIAAEPAEALACLPEIDTVLVHSPKAGQRLADLLDPTASSHLTFACISARAAEPLVARGHQKVRVAPFPDEAGLLKLL